MKTADLNKVPAGSALAVDRDNFAKEVNSKITNNENILFNIYVLLEQFFSVLRYEGGLFQNFQKFPTGDDMRSQLSLWAGL